MSRGDMKTEIIVKSVFYGTFERRFREWIHGWLQLSGYNIVGIRDENNDFYTVYEVEGDMFELFEKLYDKVRFMRRYLRADVNVAICGGDECIDLSDRFDKVVLSNSDLEKLYRLVKKLKCMVSKDEVKGVLVSGGKGYVVLVVGGCAVRFRVDEAVIFATDLASYTVNMFRLKILDEAKVVYDIFELERMKDLDVSFMVGEDGYVDIFAGGCSKRLIAGEAMQVAYKIMKTALKQLKTWKEEWEE
jgi:hypothetical protein